jgi:hypothetical protein
MAGFQGDQLAWFSGCQMVRRRSAREDKFGGGQTPRPPFHQLPPGRNGVFFAGWWKGVEAWWKKKMAWWDLFFFHQNTFHLKIGA